MKILVVDDEQLLVKGMKFNLENEGYTVETAYDGATAIDMAKSGGFDLIILDLMMPQVDGLTACMRIREFSNVPIIMLTARSEDADKIIGLESGADDYITKPFNILELKARIRALLRRTLGVDAASLQIVNRPPTRSKPLYMKVWEARKADGLDYDPDDERQQRYLSEITRYNLTHIDRPCRHSSPRPSSSRGPSPTASTSHPKPSPKRRSSPRRRPTCAP